MTLKASRKLLPSLYGTDFQIHVQLLPFTSMPFTIRKATELWDEIDYTPELHNIRIPALMLWGAEDGIVPAGVADYVYEHLAPLHRKSRWLRFLNVAMVPIMKPLKSSTRKSPPLLNAIKTNNHETNYTNKSNAGFIFSAIRLAQIHYQCGRWLLRPHPYSPGPGPGS